MVCTEYFASIDIHSATDALVGTIVHLWMNNQFSYTSPVLLSFHNERNPFGRVVGYWIHTVHNNVHSSSCRLFCFPSSTLYTYNSMFTFKASTLELEQLNKHNPCPPWSELRCYFELCAWLKSLVWCGSLALQHACLHLEKELVGFLKMRARGFPHVIHPDEDLLMSSQKSVTDLIAKDLQNHIAVFKQKKKIS